MKLSAIKVDAARIEQGAWVEDIPDMGDLKLKVRGLRNAEARKLRGTLVSAVPRSQWVKGRLPPKIADEIEAKIMSQAILDDWNLTDDSDQPIAFSREEALKYLSDPQYVKLRDAVVWSAEQVAEGTEEQAKADEGN